LTIASVPTGMVHPLEWYASVMRIIARAWLPVFVILALATAGCGSGSISTSSSDVGTRPGAQTTDSGGTARVVMRSLAFSPTIVHAKVGQRIMWTNEDSSSHNVTYVSGPKFTSSRPVLRPGAKFSIKLTQSGTVHYFCSIHPWMTATIVVSP
jgi:plastocyanin